jgi:hypothetical protein
MDDTLLKHSERIAKLLNQAENPAATEEEASAFMVKAAELMSAYAIDEAMVAAARGLTVDELVQDQFDYVGIYRTGHQQLGAAVAQHFGLKLVLGHDVSNPRPIRQPLYLAGFRSDVERARLLDTSLQLQCVTAHNKWWKEHKGECYWMDKGTTFRTRRDFVYGFAEGVAAKLAHARRVAKVEAKRNEAERTGATVEAAGASVDLVLVDRKSRVDEYYDTVWGGRTRKVTRRYGNGAGGLHAGREAGQNANTNTSAGLAGPRGAIAR